LPLENGDYFKVEGLFMLLIHCPSCNYLCNCYWYNHTSRIEGFGFSTFFLYGLIIYMIRNLCLCRCDWVSTYVLNWILNNFDVPYATVAILHMRQDMLTHVCSLLYPSSFSLTITATFSLAMLQLFFSQNKDLYGKY
jgi:hypothetical protein